MNLKSKKQMIGRMYGVGMKRIAIRSPNDVKEAITRRDIEDMVANGVIEIKAEKGMRSTKKNRARRGFGSTKKKVVDRKRDYIMLTRKLRKFLNGAREKSIVNKEKYEKLRSKIKARAFKSLGYLKEAIRGDEK